MPAMEMSMTTRYQYTVTVHYLTTQGVATCRRHQGEMDGDEPAVHAALRTTEQSIKRFIRDAKTFLITTGGYHAV
jgi:hypothetical protein